MFISETSINIFFRIFNFAILIGLALYAFVKLGIPKLSIFIAKKDSEYDSLLSQQLSLEESQFDLDKKIKSEVFLYQELKEKVVRWQETVKLTVDIQKNNQLEIIKGLHEKAEKKIEKYNQEKIKNSVQNNITTHLEKSLSQHFDKKENSDMYLKEIAQFMEKI